MIGKIIKYSFYLIIILIIFAVLPKEILDKLKKFFNWDMFLNTLKTGWNNLLNFLKGLIGIDFSQIFSKLKKTFGVDVIASWNAIKNFLANFFQKLANFFK